MKIALVSFRNDSGCPPLGLVQLGTYLQNKGHRVDLIDFNYQDWMCYGDTTYDVIGISAMTKDYGRAINLAQRIRRYVPNMPIIIGGVHISTLPISIDQIFNVGIQGEGEQAFLELLDNQQLSTLRGVVVKSKPVSNIDELPPPNWDLVNKQYFKVQPNTTWGKFCSEGVMLTSRGCPYKCVFCSTQTFWGNNVRFHSPEYVEELVRGLWFRGVTHIQVWDDLFALNINRLNEIADRIRKYKMTLNCQPRANLMSDEMCKALKNVGVKTCIFGFESGSQRILSYLKKDTVTIDNNYHAIKQCKKYGLGVQGSVIFGSPAETKVDMLCTLSFIRNAFRMGVQRIWGFVLTPFPATEVWGLFKFKDNNIVKWDELSHQNTTPYFGEFTMGEFNDVMNKLRRYELLFKIKKVLMFLKNNPILTIKYAINNCSIVSRLFKQNV
jgi:radical SAM superfamily enzyme YgiQ (UPF0313 family)